MNKNNAIEIENFIGLSAVLTGISEAKLAPELDPTNIKQIYLDTLKNNIGEELTTQLLNQYSLLLAKGKSDEEIGNGILSDRNPLSATAREIIKMWYLGSWKGKVISSQAYIQSWAWQIIQAHPMGYNEFRFGSWTTEPPQLSEFVGEDI